MIILLCQRRIILQFFVITYIYVLVFIITYSFGLLLLIFMIMLLTLIMFAMTMDGILATCFFEILLHLLFPILKQ